MGKRRFLAREHLRSGADFARVYARRASAADDCLLIFVDRNTLAHARLGLSVSRKVGNAVARNRWKRILREAFRHVREELPGDLDIVIIPRPGAAAELRPAMRSLARLAQRAAKKLPATAP